MKSMCCVIPEQVNPSPLNPSLQVQRYDPGVFMHSAFGLQLCSSVTHSSTSAATQKQPQNTARTLTLTWWSSAIVTHRCTWSRRPPSRHGSGTWSSPGRWRRKRACHSYERRSHTRRYLMQNKHFTAAGLFVWAWTRFLRNPGYLCIRWSPSWRSIPADSGRWRSLWCFHSHRADRCWDSDHIRWHLDKYKTGRIRLGHNTSI